MQPDKVTLKVYQVGFGDCFLMTFHYPDNGNAEGVEKHVLIDFGTNALPKAFGADLLKRVADDIKTTTNSQLDIVVATHRHKDHIDGFATAKNKKGPGDIIRACKPKLVLLPWTEDPNAQPNAKKPTQDLPPDQAYLRSLTSMQMFSESMLSELVNLQKALGKKMMSQLSFLGEQNLANESAVKNLLTMSPARRYLYCTADPDTEKVLPGVKIHVLGPPTLEQSTEITKKRSNDDAEFWELQASTGTAFFDPKVRAFRRRTTLRDLPPYTRWIIPQLWKLRGSQLMELVRILDKVMNNTSLILLFEIGDKVFLFPGDAQIEDWSYALGLAAKRPKLKDLLSRVDLYKVGHHGSMNATPKSLWKLFKKRSKKEGTGRLISVLSTMHGKYTDVPKTSLVDTLDVETTLFSTEKLTKKATIAQVFPFDV
jgi:hypothetical protein